MKKFFALCSVFLFSCATSGLSATNTKNDDPFEALLEKSKKVVTLEPRGENDQFYIPSIKIVGEVVDENMDAAIELLEQAKKSPDVTAVIIQMDTPGGSVDAGMRLINKMDEFPKPIICVVNGSAISMGFAILQSCTDRVMLRRAVLMAHSPSLGGLFNGTPEQWQSVADMLKAMARALAEQCSHRMKVSIDEYISHTEGTKQWWMNWEEAGEVGAIDYVSNTYKEIAVILHDTGSL